MTAGQYGFNIAALVAGGPLWSATAQGGGADGAPDKGGPAASNGEPPSGNGEKDDKSKTKGVGASKGDGEEKGK